MSTFGTNLRRRIPATGGFAKTLSVIYFIWLYVLYTIIINLFSLSRHHAASIAAGAGIVLIGVSGLAMLIPVLLNYLHDSAYIVLLYGVGAKKNRQAYLQKLDERQLDLRRQIFEKSYGILITVFFIATFFMPSWVGQHGVDKNGIMLLCLNALGLVVGLPSIVATWSKRSSLPDEENL